MTKPDAMEEAAFRSLPRQEPGYRPVDERTRDYRAVERRLSEQEIRDQAWRCMNCGTPFCHGCGCPLGNVTPEMMRLVRAGRWPEAADLLLSTNCFPEFTGRLCPSLCEDACLLGLEGEPVTIRQVELSIIEKAFETGYLRPRPPAARRPEKVAVVGSGPAGLAAAHTLNQLGFQVVVYERGARPGGLLRYGIPDFKFEKSVLDRRLKLMEAEGVSFQTEVEIGADISYRYLLSRFDALVLTGGAREPRDLRVPGRDLRGIHFALPYLAQQNRRVGGEPLGGDPPLDAAGKAVIVVGGGDTGADCLGTALRQGARRVCQLEILPKPPLGRGADAPWPARPSILRSSSSHAEGGERFWGVTIREFLGEAGAVRAVRCVEVEWPAGADGRPRPREREGTEFELECQLALLAMGFVGPIKDDAADGLDLARDERGSIRVDVRHATSRPGVFAAGDMARGQSLIVRAIADGRSAAFDIREYLEGGGGRHGQGG